MTTKKQESRDRKRRVHGYESTPLESTVVEAEPEVRRGFRKVRTPPKGTGKPSAAKSSATKTSGGKGSATGPRGQKLYRDGAVIVNGRQRIPSPTWRRTLLRTVVFLPIMWVIVHFLFSSADMSPADELMLIALYGVVTIAVMHFSETFRYRRLDRMLTESGSPPRG
jgi:hypothetical protein